MVIKDDEFNNFPICKQLATAGLVPAGRSLDSYIRIAANAVATTGLAPVERSLSSYRADQ